MQTSSGRRFPLAEGRELSRPPIWQWRDVCILSPVPLATALRRVNDCCGAVSHNLCRSILHHSDLEALDNLHPGRERPKMLFLCRPKNGVQLK